MTALLLCLFACSDASLKGDPVALAKKAAESEAREATSGTIAFEGFVLVGVALVCWLLHRRVANFWWKFLATAAGVMIFEFFTAPLWRNEHLGFWGYLYHDVSWVLTLGWTALIMGATALANALLPKEREVVRYLVTLLLLLVLVLAAENVVVSLEIRHYAPEVEAILSGYKIGVVPVEALYYVPVFTGLVVAFAGYWGHYVDDTALVPVVRTRWLRALGLTVLAVVLFEVMVEPIVENRHFPEWSYFYRDLNFLLTGAWVVMIAAAALLVQRFLVSRPLPVRFVAVLLLILALALPFESWLIREGYRVYGQSATANFCGLNTWLTGVPIEIVFAIPMYMALVIAFIRYWEIVGDNNL